MAAEDPGKVSYSDIGGLGDQIRQIREVIELPLINPDLFARVGINPPKGVLLFGPPGTGKTLLARAIACNIEASFLKVVSSAIVDKYIGESARLIREMFGYAKEHQVPLPFLSCQIVLARERGKRKQCLRVGDVGTCAVAFGWPLTLGGRGMQPCVIFMDEIDAIGGRRFSEGTSADREIQRTLMELLNQVGDRRTRRRWRRGRDARGGQEGSSTSRRDTRQRGGGQTVGGRHCETEGSSHRSHTASVRVEAEQTCSVLLWHPETGLRAVMGQV